MAQFGEVEGPDSPSSGGDQLAVIGEVSGEEQRQRDLGEFAGLEVDRTEADPDPRPAFGVADARHERQQQQRRADRQEAPLVAGQVARSLDDHQRDHVGDDCHERPRRLQPRGAFTEPGDHDVPDAVQQRSERQDRAVGTLGQHSVREVSDHEQSEDCDRERYEDRWDHRVLPERRQRVRHAGDGRGHHDQSELRTTPSCGDRCRAHGPDVLVPTIVVVGLEVAMVLLVELVAGVVSGVVAGSVTATVVVGASSSWALL